MRTKAFFLIISLLGLCNYNRAFAQFYDKEDEIYFYVCIKVDGEFIDVDRNNKCYVFNFDGEKATDFGKIEGAYASNILGVKNILKNNIDSFERNVFNVNFNIRHRPDLSSSSWVTYSRHDYGYYGHSWTNYWYFSRDRKTMIFKVSSSNTEWEYKLVDKDYFMESRRRSNLNNEVIYE